jgi:hypothetical protein
LASAKSVPSDARLGIEYIADQDRGGAVMAKRKKPLTAGEWLKSPAGRKAIKEGRELAEKWRREFNESQRNLHKLMDIPIVRF